MWQSARRGFSLLEVLVVFVVVGMLTTLLFPAFARSSDRSAARSCIANLHRISVAVQQCQADFGGELPPENPYHWPETNGDGIEYAAETPGTYLAAYGITNAVANCPNSEFVGELGAYDWRFQVNLSHQDVPSYRALGRNWRSVEPEPSSVIAYCNHHLTKGFSREPLGQNVDAMRLHQGNYFDSAEGVEGNYLALRDDGSVQSVPAQGNADNKGKFDAGNTLTVPHR